MSEATPILHMLSPQKHMSPFDVNMAADAGWKVIVPYINVTLEEVTALTQDAIFSRPPNFGVRTGLFIGGKDAILALDMMDAAEKALVPPFGLSTFADPAGSFTTAAAMVACVERVLRTKFNKSWKGTKVAVFGATGVVGFASSIIAALEGAQVTLVAHRGVDRVVKSAEVSKQRFGVDLIAKSGETEDLKRAIIADAEVIFAAAAAGVRVISAEDKALAKNLLVVADVNAVPPPGVEGMELFMDGAALPGCNALGVGPLAIGDIKYKTEAGLFKRMLDFRQAGALRLPRRLRAGAHVDLLTTHTVLIAALSGRGLAASARRAGYLPLVADAFGDSDTAELAAAACCVTDAARIGFRAKPVFAALAALEAAAPSPPIGLVLGSGFEDRPKLIAALSRRYRLIGNGAETIARAKNPAGFFALLDTLGIAHPATQLAPPSDDGRLAVEAHRRQRRHACRRCCRGRPQPAPLLSSGPSMACRIPCSRWRPAIACTSSASAANGPSVRDRVRSATAAPLVPCSSQRRSIPRCETPPERCALRSGWSASSPSTSCSSVTPRSWSR